MQKFSNSIPGENWPSAPPVTPPTPEPLESQIRNDLARQQVDYAILAETVDATAQVELSAPSALSGSERTIAAYRTVAIRLAANKAEAPPATQAPWIATKDQMPTAHGEYWVWLIPHKPQPSILEPDESVFVDFKPYARNVRTYTDRQGKIRFNCGAVEFPQYWMRLPSPPVADSAPSRDTPQPEEQ